MLTKRERYINFTIPIVTIGQATANIWVLSYEGSITSSSLALGSLFSTAFVAFLSMTVYLKMAEWEQEYGKGGKLEQILALFLYLLLIGSLLLLYLDINNIWDIAIPFFGIDTIVPTFTILMIIVWLLKLFS